MDRFASTVRWLRRGIAAALGFLALLPPGTATELVSRDDKFVVTRDFRAYVIKA